jgi:hypothetical protein
MQSRAAYVASKAATPDAALKSFMDRWRSRPLTAEEKKMIKELIYKVDVPAALKIAEERGETEVADLLRQYQQRYGAMELAHQKLVADVGPRIGSFIGTARKRRTRKTRKSRRVTRRR